SAFVVLLCYLLFSAYSYIRVAIHHAPHMSYVGLGATDFRILMTVWASLGVAFQIHEPLVDGVSHIDLAVLVMATIAICGLGIKAIVDAREVAATEGLAPMRNAVADMTAMQSVSARR
ncbi:MAG: hypothetical protein KGM42_19900, partial [Hyphomicrobiales bacterium]|nr:hypothetical protein [Hyphomicrobiales bacterium]